VLRGGFDVAALVVKENVGAGNPVAVSWKLLPVPIVNVVLSALVNTGASIQE